MNERFVKLWGTTYYESEIENMSVAEVSEIVENCKKSIKNFKTNGNQKAEYAVTKCLEWISSIYEKKLLELSSREAKLYKAFYEIAEKSLFKFKFNKLKRLAESQVNA